MQDYRQDLKREELRRGIVRWVVRILLGGVAVVVVKYAWQYSIAEIFHLPELTYTQAFALWALCRALIGWPELMFVMQRSYQRFQYLRFEGFMQHLFLRYFGKQQDEEPQDDPAAKTKPRHQNQTLPPVV